MSIGLSTTRTPGPDLTIHCPRCNRASKAISYDLDEDAKLLSLIPILKLRSTWVECVRCGEKLLSKVPARQLTGLSPQELAEVVGVRVSLAAKMLAIVSIALCWTPGLGVLLGAIAIVANLKSSGWPKVASRIGMGLSVTVSLILGISYFWFQPSRNRPEATTAPALTGETAPSTLQKAMAGITPTLAQTIASANAGPPTVTPNGTDEPVPTEPPSANPTTPAPTDRARSRRFSGKRPEAWNSNATGETTAITLGQAPRDIRYLRLKRLDTGEAIIIGVNYAQLNTKVDFRDRPNLAFRWNGSGEFMFGGRHLGIVEGGLVRGLEKKGAIAVQMEGFDYGVGSGFGHESYGDGRTQHFGWHGKKIAPTSFEIAITTDELNDQERALLLED